MHILRNKKIYLGIGLLVVLVSLGLAFTLGERFSVEFTGGSSLSVSFPTDDLPNRDQVQSIAVESLGDENVQVRQAGDSYTIETKTIADGAEQTLIDDLSASLGSEASLVESASFGPSLSKELARSSVIALTLAFVVIVLFVAFAFRRTTWAIPSWMYGLIALVALLHDIIVPIGLYAVLGVFLPVEVDILFVTALLAILGYSINDTLVVFDRIRENLEQKYAEAKPDPQTDTDRPRLRNRYEENAAEEKPETKSITPAELEETIGRSVNQTISRSINTSLTTAVILVSLYLLGGEATKSFSLVLLAGVIAGTYSSIFIASPLLAVVATKFRAKGIKQ